MKEWFNATNLLEYKNKNNERKKRFADFWENSFVQEFIKTIKSNGIRECYRTKRGRGGYTEMRCELFPLFIEWLCPELMSDYKNKYTEEYDSYLKLKKNSISTTYKKREIDFTNVLESLVYPKNTYFHKQYVVGSKFIDFVIHHKNKDFGDSYILIEFDEQYHNNDNQLEKDKIREKELSEYFEKQENVSYVCMIRVPYDKVGIAYTYLIPYITGIETSLCSSKIQELLNYKCLYCDD